MQQLDGWDKFLSTIQVEHKPVHNPNLSEHLIGILKLMGADPTELQRYTFDMIYWFVEAFISNGSYSRDFSVGPIKLVEIPKFEISMDYVEEVFESRTGWGTMVGVRTKEEALEIVESSPTDWIEDSEHNDSDYGDLVEVDNFEVTKEENIVFKRNWIGLR